MNWKQMTARERDAAVIREVLGWPVYETKEASLQAGDTVPYVAWLWQKYLYFDGEHEGRPFSPSTSIGDAWMVVEHLITKKYHTTIWVAALDNDAVDHICRVDTDDGTEHVYWGATAAEAICKAALAVVGRA